MTNVVKNAVWASTLLLIMLGPFPTLAQAQLADRLKQRFDQLDKNNDGKVTEKEAGKALLFRRLLKRLDKNRDGALQKSELTPSGEPTAAQQYKSPPEPEHTKHLNIAYDKIEGVDANLLSLDLYVPKKSTRHQKSPVMIMIHGGGWQIGDKANSNVIAAKMKHFVGQGYIYASINYRLTSPRKSNDDVKHPIHIQDCAKAVAWIHNNIKKYNGDPNQLHLMGHSAGGHLAALLATNERFLKAEHKDLSIIKTNVLLDPAAIHIVDYLNKVKRAGISGMYQKAFGTDEKTLRDASPWEHVTAGKNIPPTLLFYTGRRMLLNQFGPAYAERLTKAGARSQAVDTLTLSHGEISGHIGLVNEPMTALIMKLHAGEKANEFPSSLDKVKIEREATNN